MYTLAETEELLKPLDNIYGAKKCKEILKNYITFLDMRDTKQLKRLNYNIFINNRSEHSYYENVVEIIEKVLMKKNIINVKGRYLKKEHLKKEKGEYKNFKDVKEKLLIIDAKRMGISSYCLSEEIREFMVDSSDKIFIVIGDCVRDGSFNIEMGDLVAWFMEMEKMTTDDKEDYVKKYFSNQQIKISSKSTFVSSIVKEPFWKIRDEVLNIALECKARNVKTIDDNFIKKELKKKYYSMIYVKPKKKLKGLEDLNYMVGMKDVKDQIDKIMNFIKVNKDRKNMPALHMCFTGNPGTGKTTVARIVGKVFAENEIFSDEEKFKEVHGRDLVGQYVGWTAYETKRIIDSAMGGVLFIDEAYSLNASEIGGFEDEAIATLIKEMEDKRDKICIILAGYKKEMKELIDRNPGFDSRIQFKINFPDYTEDELYEIFKHMARDEKYKISNNLKETLMMYFKEEKKKYNFSNGRCVRNIFEKIKFEQSNRVIHEDSKNIDYIKKIDVVNAIQTVEREDTKEEKRKIGF